MESETSGEIDNAAAAATAGLIACLLQQSLAGSKKPLI